MCLNLTEASNVPVGVWNGSELSFENGASVFQNFDILFWNTFELNSDHSSDVKLIANLILNNDDKMLLYVLFSFHNSSLNNIDTKLWKVFNVDIGGEYGSSHQEKIIELIRSELIQSN